MNAAAIRELFPGLTDTIYLNTATLGVGCAPAREAHVRALERWSKGRFDWVDAERAGESCRTGFARIVGAAPDEIAIVPAVSTAAGIVAANMPPGKPGENVVVAGNEFTSNYFPWLLLRDRGYDVRVVRPAADGASAEDYAALADAGTRLIAVSAVQSSTGFRADLSAMSEVAARSGAWLFVDAGQAAGAVPIDVSRDKIDFLAAASYKFLLGSRGLGYLYVRRPLIDRIRPISPGWKAARNPLESFYGPEMNLSPTASKLDGSLAWFAALADEATFEMFLRLGIGAVCDRNARLSRRLQEGLVTHGSPVRLFPERHRSTIVSVPVKDTAAVMARLGEANVIASVRAGRVRLSVHFYNTEEELDRVAELLAGA